MSKKHKTGSSPRTPQEVSPSKRGASSRSTASSLGSVGIIFAGKNPEQKFKLVTSAPEQPLRHLPDGQGVLSVEQVTVQVTDHPHIGAPLITPSLSTDPPPPFIPSHHPYSVPVEPLTPVPPAQLQDANHGMASPVSVEMENRIYNRLAEDVRNLHCENQESFNNSLVRLMSGGFVEQAAHSSSLAGPSSVRSPCVTLPPRDNSPVNANGPQGVIPPQGESINYNNFSSFNFNNQNFVPQGNNGIPLLGNNGSGSQENPLHHMIANLQYLSERMLRMEERNPPPPAPLTVSQRVSSESLEKVSLLSFLKDYFPAIQPIHMAGKSEFLAHDYNFLWNLGFWKIPPVDPIKMGVCLVSLRPNQIGFFEVLKAPTLLAGYKPNLDNSHWTSDTLAGQQSEEHLDPSKDPVDNPLRLQVVPGRCLKTRN